MTNSPYTAANTRRNAVAFLVGKVPTALLTIAVLWMASRSLNANEFGRYVAVMATLEVSLGFSSFGFDWILLRYVPEYRVNHSRSGLIRLVCMVVAGRGFVLLLLASCLYFFNEIFVSQGIQATANVAMPLALLIVVEGILRIFRDNMLESLAMQRYLQIVLIAKGLCLVGGLLFLANSGGDTAREILFVELTASALSLCLAVGIVIKALAQLPNTQTNFRPPSIRQMRNTALSNYASGFVEYLYSPSSLLVLLARSQPTEVIAGVGFVIRLVEILRNYMPSMLIYGVVRARMIGAFAHTKDYSELHHWALFLFKISILTLFPACGVVVVYGDTILAVASGGRYSPYHLLLVTLCFWLALVIHRRILAVVFNAVNLMPAWATASFTSFLFLPLLFLFGYEKLGVWFVPVALFTNEIVVNVVSVFVLKRRGFEWGSCGTWLLKAIASIGIACSAVLVIDRTMANGVVFGMISFAVVYMFALTVLGAVNQDDARMINRALGRHLFRFV